jgi:hypothetical protein
MKKLKPSLIIIVLFIFYWGIIYNGHLVKINEVDYAVNLIQTVLLFIVFLNLYFFINLLLGNKTNVEVLSLLKRKNIFALGKFSRCLLNTKLTNGDVVVLSKLCRSSIPSVGSTLKVYYTFSNKIRIIDSFIIGIRVLIIIFCLSILVLLDIPRAI